MKLSKDFSDYEFVTPEIYQQFGIHSCWFIDPKLVAIAQFIRDRFNKPVTINNFLNGGPYRDSGFRDSSCQIGATNSQHRHGRAIDFRVQGMTPQQVRNDIIRNYDLYRTLGLTTMEADTPTWVHIDCRFTNQETLLIVPFK